MWIKTQSNLFRKINSNLSKQKITMTRFLILLSVFLFTIPSIAQQKWSLQQCLDYAEKNNIVLQQSYLNEDLAEIDLEQSKQNRLPFVNGGLTQQLNFGRSVDPTTYEFVTQTTPVTGLNLNGGIDLFTGWRNKYTIERNDLSVKNAETQSLIQENNIALSIVTAYLDILNAREQIKVLQEQAKLTIDQRTRVEKLIAAGVLPKGDIYNLEAQIANDELSLVRAENIEELARLNLAQLMNIEFIPDIQEPSLPPPSLDDLTAMSVDVIYREALKSQPEIKSSDLQESIAALDINLAESGKYPQVSVFGGANTNFVGLRLDEIQGFNFNGIDTTFSFVSINNETYPILEPSFVPEIGKGDVRPLFTQFGDNFSFNVGLSVQVPIFNRYQVKNNVRRAELSVKNAALQSTQARNQLRQLIQQAYQTARAAAKVYETYLTNINSLEQNFNNLQKRYDAGVANVLELQTAQNALSVARLNLNAAKYDYWFRLKVLDFYQGKQISF